MDLQDEVAVVTGGGARSEDALGIGEATCLRFAEAGAHVVVADVDGGLAERTAGLIEAAGGPRAVAVEADVTDEADAAALADRCAAAFGGADVLVNNAGIRVPAGPVTEVAVADVRRVVDVNLTGMAVCARHVVPEIADGGERDGGAVVNVASANATVGRSGWAPYDAAKAGVLGLTRDMACDHADQGIRVNAVSPGWTVTDYHLGDLDPDERAERLDELTAEREGGPAVLKRNAHPREQAEAILFLASEAASYVTATNLHVDGGMDAVGRRL